MPSQLPARSQTPPARAPGRGPRSARQARRRTTTTRPTVPPVERANGWLVAIAVLAGGVLFSVLAMNAFLGS
ncbi:hypothetical protein IF650_07735 [Cellulosimicrobium terreum]|nr:hypothetical protein [Cellulosimicrobium terreum]